MTYKLNILMWYFSKKNSSGLNDLYDFWKHGKIKVVSNYSIQKMTEYPPYIDAYGQLPRLFKGIGEASVPSRFTQDFLSSVLELKSSSHRSFIPFLKKLGFLDSSNNPTNVYLDYRDEDMSKFVMAEQIKKSYAQLYKAHSYANKLSKPDIISKLSSVLGVGKSDQTLPKVASTFMELCKLANFDEPQQKTSRKEREETKGTPEIGSAKSTIASQEVATEGITKLGISYVINLVLPPATDPKVFDAIFKSLKEHLIK